MRKANEYADAFGRVFSTHEGRIVLEYLRTNYKERKMVADQSTNAMLIRAAQHDVVIDIERMIEVAKHGGPGSDKN